MPRDGDFSGFFSIESGKTITIQRDEPFEGWVTLGFSDETDELALNSQMFYVPEPLFYSAVTAYLEARDA
jgi:hypothetical protein